MGEEPFIYEDDKKEFCLKYPLGYGGRGHRPRVSFPATHLFVEKFVETKNILVRGEVEKAGAGSKEILEIMNALKAEVIIPSFLAVRNTSGERSTEQTLRSLLVLGQKKSDQEYTEEDLSVFFTIAQESAIAAEKARLFDVLLKEREEKVRAQADAKMVACARSMAHETKNALAAMYSPAEVLSNYVPQDLSAFVAHYSPDLKENANAQRTLGKMIRMMKEKGAVLRQKAEEIRIVTKTVQGTLTSDCTEFQQFSFKVVWDGAVAEVAVRYPEVKLFRELPLPYPYGNVVLLQRVLTNLFMNAAEARGDKTDLEILTRGVYEVMDGKDGTLFEVVDNGTGITPENLKRIFEQGFSTKQKPKAAETDVSGYGQGLWVCRQTIEEIHSGKFWVESEMGKGSVFKFWIPFGPGCIKL